MIQEYLEYDNRKLFLAKHSPDNPSSVVVLLSGLGYTKNEYAYFYSKLARKLSNVQAIIQFDYSGHGDSDGDFSDATVPVLVQDVKSVIRYCKLQYPNLPLTIISHGIGTWIVPYCDLEIDKWIVWNPVFTIPYRFIEKIINGISPDEYIEIADLPCFEMPSESRLFFEMLGSDWWNVLRGERFSKKQIITIQELKSNVLLDYMKNINSLHFLYGFRWKYMNRKESETYIFPREDDFVRSPLGQEWAIERIDSILMP